MSKRPYSTDTLKLAVSSVKQKRLTITQASREYGVPRKTVDNHAREIIKRHTFGPARMLEEEEKQALVRYLEYMAGQGFPMTRAMIRTYVVELARHRETLFIMDSGPSDKWFWSFFARHPELTERVPERYDKVRARMSSQVVMDQYFYLLEKKT